ncbi:MAG: hypothetical protein IPL61_35165 [Myxococcales bacterium]|nr:hypothetical protein [Myxococcales bacterium]
MLVVALGAVAVIGCASARTPGEVDAAVAADAGAVDAPDLDGGDVDAPDLDAAPIDAAPIDAALLDAALLDARPIDAVPADAPIDAVPIDAACTPTWTNLLGNGGFEVGVTPWTQTTTIIRTSAQMPFAPQAGTYAALLGATNNANDVLVQTVTIPATSTGLRLRGYNCFVTEDIIITDADRFTARLETPAGVAVETLASETNSTIAPICAWLPFTWTAAGGHPGETLVLRFQVTTNFALLSRFALDSLALEALACP